MLHQGHHTTKVLHILHLVVQGSRSRPTSSSQAAVDDGEIQQRSATTVIGSDHNLASVRRRPPQISIGRRLQISYEVQAWQNRADLRLPASTIDDLRQRRPPSKADPGMAAASRPHLPPADPP
ncbi:hypothetical protein ACLOJK_014580, partial [Asimina triloba]